MKFNKYITRKVFNKIINEELEPRTTSVKKSVDEYIEELSKDIGKPIVSGPIENSYIIDFVQPHYAVIKPITQDIFEYTYYRDESDRTRGVYVKFDELKKILKDLIDKDKKNYVDSAYDKNVENSKYDTNSKEVDSLTVDFGGKSENKKAKDMNKEEDNPDKPMREVGKFKRLSEYGETKAKYTQPKLSKEESKIKIKIEKTSKL